MTGLGGLGDIGRLPADSPGGGGKGLLVSDAKVESAVISVVDTRLEAGFLNIGLSNPYLWLLAGLEGSSDELS